MTNIADDVEQIRRNDEAIELLHKLGAEVETRHDPSFEERDWDAEAFLDLWVGRYTLNIALHYQDILREKNIDVMRHCAKGSAIAVVGAGPSLDKNADQLHDFPGLIIACDRAAAALTARGIRPDLVICVDPRPALMADMLNYPENRDQKLAMCVTVDPEVSRIWRGPKYYMSTFHPGTQFFDRVIPELFPGMPGLLATGNVGNSAVQMAAFLGAEKIVLVGHDYSYTGGRMHCSDWVRYPNGSWVMVADEPGREAEKLKRRTGKVVVDGIETYKPFVGYRDTLQQMVCELKFDVVNATEGGILNALSKADLSSVIAELKNQNKTADEAHARFRKATGGV